MQPDAPNSNFKAVPLPEGNQVKARCYGVIEIGMVLSTYPGKEPTKSRQLMFLWELPTLQAVFVEEKGQQPFMVMKEVKYSTDDRSNLSKLISNWRNQPFTEQEKLSYDAGQCLNKIGLLGFVVKRKKAYEGQQIEQVTNENSSLVLNTISPLPTEMQQGMPACINPHILWDWSKMLTTADFNKEMWERIPKFIQKKIRTSDEFIQRNMASVVPEETQQNQQANQAPVQEQAPTQQQAPIQQQSAQAPQDSGFGGDTF